MRAAVWDNASEQFWSEGKVPRTADYKVELICDATREVI